MSDYSSELRRAYTDGFAVGAQSGGWAGICPYDHEGDELAWRDEWMRGFGDGRVSSGTAVGAEEGALADEDGRDRPVSESGQSA